MWNAFQKLTVWCGFWQLQRYEHYWSMLTNFFWTKLDILVMNNLFFHIGYTTLAIWGRTHQTGCWCESVTEITRFNTVNIFLWSFVKMQIPKNQYALCYRLKIGTDLCIEVLGNWKCPRARSILYSTHNDLNRTLKWNFDDISHMLCLYLNFQIGRV